MKLLKGRKLIERPLQLESRTGRILHKLKHFFAEINRRKLFIFNLIILLLTAGYAVKYYLDQQEVKQQEAQAQEEVEKEGERLRDIFFNSVYEEEMRAQREQEEAEARRKASIAAATEDEATVENNDSDAENTDGETNTESNGVIEEVQAETEVVIDPTEVLEQINDNQSSEFPVYENKTYKYKLTYPPNWYLDKETKADSWLAYITSYNPAGHDRSELPQNPRLEILVQENVRSLSLDDWMQEGYKYNGDPQSSDKIQVAGVDAYRNIETNPYPAIVVTLIRENYIYTLTYAGGDITNKDNVKIFDFMLNNFKF